MGGGGSKGGVKGDIARTSTGICSMLSEPFMFQISWGTSYILLISSTTLCCMVVDIFSSDYFNFIIIFQEKYLHLVIIHHSLY